MYAYEPDPEPTTTMPRPEHAMYLLEHDLAQSRMAREAEAHAEAASRARGSYLARRVRPAGRSAPCSRAARASAAVSSRRRTEPPRPGADAPVRRAVPATVGRHSAKPGSHSSRTPR